MKPKIPWLLGFYIFSLSPIPIEARTLKGYLLELVSKRGMVEVLDRVADISHDSNAPNASQMTKLLEAVVQLGLAQEEATGISAN